MATNNDRKHKNTRTFLLCTTLCLFALPLFLATNNYRSLLAEKKILKSVFSLEFALFAHYDASEKMVAIVREETKAVAVVFKPARLPELNVNRLFCLPKSCAHVRSDVQLIFSFSSPLPPICSFISAVSITELCVVVW